MAIKVSGTVVVDNDRNANAGVVTATSLNVNPIPITFSPTDGSSDNAIDTNIVITYNASITKGSGNITLREGSASGTVIETIAVSSGFVSISGGAATINPNSDLPTGKDIYVVVDEGAFVQSNTELGGSSPLLNTYNFTTGRITTSSFSPSDGATNVAVESNIVITFSENITKQTTASTSYITLRAGGASGTVRQTIDVSTSAVSVSGSQATINPPSDLENLEDTYVVVDENSFFNSDGDEASGNAVINTYNFTTETGIVIPPLGQCNSTIGGYLLCCSSGNLWVLAPYASEVNRFWADRTDANTKALQETGCTGWFVPSQNQLNNPGYQCRTYWDCIISTGHWSDTTVGPNPPNAYRINMQFGNNTPYPKGNENLVRSFRCVSY